MGSALDPDVEADLDGGRWAKIQDSAFSTGLHRFCSKNQVRTGVEVCKSCRSRYSRRRRRQYSRRRASEIPVPEKSKSFTGIIGEPFSGNTDESFTKVPVIQKEEIPQDYFFSRQHRSFESGRREVWAHNVVQEFHLISMVVEQGKHRSALNLNAHSAVIRNL